MKIPLGTDGAVRRNGETAETGRQNPKVRSGADAFRQILEKKMTPAAGAVSGGNPTDAPDEKTIRQLIDVIRLRMMMDENMLDSMRDKGSDLFLYQRFARWHMGGINAISSDAAQSKPTGPVHPAAEITAQQAVDEIPSVVRLPKVSERARQYEPIIQQASTSYGVDPELIRAVIRAESNFRSESTSPKGAMGLMQIMPATAKDLGIRDAYDPQENIMGGTRYLKGLLDRYRGDVPTALAAYNWGMGNVERRPEKLPRETQVYINRIQQFMDEGKA